ncbi:MAG: hypothetical protein HYS41_00700 [Candidatus Omnitrophica bacterium]|nr:hypothetical protein [Candidatus Omnitrophota bacterium]
MKDIKERTVRTVTSLTLFPFLTLTLFWLPGVPLTFASDGATEALELRLTAEKSIAGERNKKLARAMEQALPELLQEYLATRDGTIAMDAIDSAFVEAQFKIARSIEEPGVALALDVFSGPGSGYENDLRTSISNLADFKAESAERFAGRISDRTERVSERTLDVFEREMERQMDKVEQEVAKFAAFDRLDSKVEAKMEARMDVMTARFLGPEKAAEQLSERAEKLAEKAASLASTNPELAEKLSEKAEKLAEKAQELEAKAEEVSAKVEDLGQKVEEKAEEPAADQVVEKVVDRAARGAELAAQRAEEQARAEAAAAERAARGAELLKQQEEQAKLDAEKAAARFKK